jgi:hypothetical protein
MATLVLSVRLSTISKLRVGTSSPNRAHVGKEPRDRASSIEAALTRLALTAQDRRLPTEAYGPRSG